MRQLLKNIEVLISRFEAVNDNDALPELGFTVRALHHDNGRHQVVEFTYPLFPLAKGSGFSPNVPPRKYIPEVVALFNEYLSSYENPIVEILVFEMHENVLYPQDPSDLAVLETVAQATDRSSLKDVVSGGDIAKLSVGAIVGSVVYNAEGSKPKIQLHEEHLTGNLMEMVLGFDGQRVRLHPKINTLPSDFHRFRSFSMREDLAKILVRPDLFQEDGETPTSAQVKLKIGSVRVARWF